MHLQTSVGRSGRYSCHPSARYRCHVCVRRGTAAPGSAQRQQPPALAPLAPAAPLPGRPGQATAVSRRGAGGCTSLPEEGPPRAASAVPGRHGSSGAAGSPAKPELPPSPRFQLWFLPRALCRFLARKVLYSRSPNYFSLIWLSPNSSSVKYFFLMSKAQFLLLCSSHPL